MSKNQPRTQEQPNNVSRRVEADKPVPTIEAASQEVSQPNVETAPVLTPELISRLRAAGSIDAGVEILAPRQANKAKADQTYELNTMCAQPLPQKRGVCLKVITAAVRLDRPFKIGDITAMLPDVKAAAYWTRQLAKTGHLKEVTFA